jgi:para-nitrobenzyl esterase
MTPPTKRTVTALLAVTATLALALTGCTNGAGTTADATSNSDRAAPAVEITQGTLTGNATSTTNEYLGIPYAKPPVGDLRWRAPEQPEPWQDTFNATVPGPACPQMPGGDTDGSQTENCLYLNVYSPAEPKSEKLPVVVFLHGGGHIGGSPNVYDGRNFASNGDALVVIPAFRVGLFGFFGAEGTAAEGEYGAQGNWGMLDQQQALRWVQDNIAAFGGDPGNVTLVGESAGGYSVCFQLASPTAAGLFQKAIIESAGCLGPEGPMDTTSFADSWGCDPADMTCLRNVDTAAILASTAGQTFGFAHPVAGGPDQPLEPLAAAAAGDLADVPVIIGVTRDEWLGFESANYPLDPEEYESNVTEEFGADADEVLQRYPADAGPDPIYAAGWLRGDVMFACTSVATADAFDKAGKDVYFYEFADRTTPGFRSVGDPFPPSNLELGATHTAELQYLFNYTAAQRPLDADQRKLADQLIEYWTEFATTGKPSAEGAAEWQPFATDREVLEIVPLADGGPVMDGGFEQVHNCDYWNAE